MNCYSLVVKGEWPDTFCPLPSSLMQNNQTWSRRQGQAAERASTVLCACPCIPVTTGLCPALLSLRCLQLGSESLCPALHLGQERKAKQLCMYGKQILQKKINLAQSRINSIRSSQLKRSVNLDFNFLLCPASWESSALSNFFENITELTFWKKSITSNFMFLQVAEQYSQAL